MYLRIMQTIEHGTHEFWILIDIVTISLNQSGPGSNFNVGVFHTSQISRSGASTSDSV